MKITLWIATLAVIAVFAFANRQTPPEETPMFSAEDIAHALNAPKPKQP